MRITLTHAALQHLQQFPDNRRLTALARRRLFGASFVLLGEWIKTFQGSTEGQTKHWKIRLSAMPVLLAACA